jgi:hypothetical protein
MRGKYVAICLNTLQAGNAVQSPSKEITMRPLWVIGLCSVLVNALAAEDKPPFRLVQTIELPGKPGKLDHFGFDAAGGRLLVSNQGNSSLNVIDTETG